MQELATSPLASWESFYVIVGSSAAALTGLQFVVMALVADVRGMNPTTDTVDAFSTPNVVHFSAALFISAVLSAPWPHLCAAAAVLGATGLAGMVYIALVVRRARRQTGYKPVFEDWLWHVTLPFIAYTGIVAAALLSRRDLVDALFGIGGITLLLLFIGIHNAWDTVTWITVGRSQEGTTAGDTPRPPVT